MPFSASRTPSPLPCTSTRHTLLCRHSFTTHSALPCAVNCARPLPLDPRPSQARSLPQPPASLAPWQYTCAHCRSAADGRVLDAFHRLGTRLFASGEAANGRGRRGGGAAPAELGAEAWEARDCPALSAYPACLCFTLTPPQEAPREVLDVVSLHDPALPSEALAELCDPLAGWKFFFTYRSLRSGMLETAYVLLLADSVRDRLERSGDGYAIRATGKGGGVAEARRTAWRVVKGVEKARRECERKRREVQEGRVEERDEETRGEVMAENGSECSRCTNTAFEGPRRTASETSSWLDRLDSEDGWTHAERKELWQDLFQQLNASTPSFWSASSKSQSAQTLRSVIAQR